MSNEIQIFNNPEFGDVRVVEAENETWFVGKDVADKLGYADTNKAIAMHVDDRIKNSTTKRRRVLDSAEQRTLINESGLYSLILSSKLSTAKKFKRWVTSEVLPQIRKTGSYGKPMSQVDILVESAKALQEQERRLARIELDIADIKKEQQIQSSRIDTFNGVCTEDTKRQKLFAMIQAYAKEQQRMVWPTVKAGTTSSRHTIRSSIPAWEMRFTTT